ncbi:MAG: hypothetical protein HY682_04350 [Chloroflexi bacterium]|nr:hypothetical protein [Chloroflexota bacterium]
MHGTFSTSRAGFAGLPPATLSALYQMYEGRVFAFDHFTLSEGPEKNAAELLNLIPIDVRLDLDVVCHSRGGLLARVLSEDSPPGKERRIRIRRIVFVGTPNHGTALADPDHLVTMIDRYTSILNLAPPGPLSTVTEVLEGVITAVKVIGHAAVNGLDGISAMNPRGAFLRTLNARAPASETEYYGIAANFEPGGSLKQYVKQAVADRILDRVFDDEENDLIVPTIGVYKGTQLPGFPIPDSRVLRFQPRDSVAHTQYFARAETSTRLLQWLSAG